MNLLAKLKALFVPTVDAIVIDFNNTVDRLEALAEHHSAKSIAATIKADAHKAKAALHFEESERALKVAEKIKSLVA